MGIVQNATPPKPVLIHATHATIKPKWKTSMRKKIFLISQVAVLNVIRVVINAPVGNYPEKNYLPKIDNSHLTVSTLMNANKSHAANIYKYLLVLNQSYGGQVGY